jgi:N-acetylglutamate synthase-like GNAT family acetyltransferase
MSLSRKQFKDRLYDIWGRHYSLPANIFLKSGTCVIAWKSFKDSQYIVQESIGKQTIMRCDPVLLGKVKSLVKSCGKDKAMTYADCVSAWGESALEPESRGDYCHLYPDDFVPCLIDKLSLRQLTEADTPALDLMKSACSENDVEEGEVNTHDELAIGAFDDDKMVACASMYDWHGFADIGVLVHPDYRQQSLGKAVVSLICQHLLAPDYVLTYRYDVNNTGSKRIAKSLGFTQYSKGEAFKVVNYA